MSEACSARSVSELVQLCAKGESPKYIYFWGHKPKVEGRIDHSCLSQWYPSPFEVDGVRYATAEHFMMACKARLFNDSERLAEALAAPSPGAAKAVGRKVRGFDGAIWERERFSIVVAASVAKFFSSDELRSYLLRTSKRILVEASPHDTIWGIGLDARTAQGKHPRQWKGLNLLGFALMEARQILFGGDS